MFDKPCFPHLQKYHQLSQLLLWQCRHSTCTCSVGERLIAPRLSSSRKEPLIFYTRNSGAGWSLLKFPMLLLPVCCLSYSSLKTHYDGNCPQDESLTYLIARGLDFTLWLLYPPPCGSSVWLHECAHITVVPSRMCDLSRQEDKKTICLWWSSHKSRAIVCSRIYASETSYRSWTHAQGTRLGSHMFGGGVSKSV